MRLAKIFSAIFAPDERLPSSAALCSDIYSNGRHDHNGDDHQCNGEVDLTQPPADRRG